jgi:hypothetical protein
VPGNLSKGLRSICRGGVGFFNDIDLFQVGKDIISGLVKGIGSMAGAVGSAVAGIAKGIPAGVKKLLGIHSPSRVMMALGEFTGEGFAIGVGDMQKMVSQASAKLANATMIDGGSVGAMSVAPIRRNSGAVAATAASSSDSKLDLLVAAIREQLGRRDPNEVVVIWMAGLSLENCRSDGSRTEKKGQKQKLGCRNFEQVNSNNEGSFAGSRIFCLYYFRSWLKFTERL